MNTFTLLIVCIILYLIINFGSKENFNSKIVEKFNDSEFNVYVIHMAKNKDRLINFDEYYNKSDIKFKPYEIFPAVVGKDLNLVNYVTEKAYEQILMTERTGNRIHHYDLSPGAVGCYLSHLSIYKKLVNSNLKYAIIFEDDSIMVSNFYEKVLYSLNVVPDDWDILLLGVICLKCDEFKDYIKINRFWGTHGYIINKQSAKKILEFLDKPLSKQIDTDMSILIKRGLIKVYGVNPILVNQDPKFGSDIQSHVIDSPEAHNEEFIQQQLSKIHGKRIIDATYNKI